MSKKTVWRQVTRSCILSLLSISLETCLRKLKSVWARRAVWHTLWTTFPLFPPVVLAIRRMCPPRGRLTLMNSRAGYRAPMDSVTSPATAIAMGKMGALGVLDLEGLWTRYDDPQPLLDEIAELRPKARPSVFSRSTPSRSSRSSLSSVCMRFVTPASPLRAPCPRSARRTIIRPCSKRASTCSSSAARSFPPSTSPRITSH